MVALTLLAACSESTAPAPPATNLVISHGDRQEAISGDTLPETVAVRLVDDRGTPLAGHVVQWTTDAAGGRFEPVQSTTNAEGVAETRWRLGLPLGDQVALARTDGYPEPLRFHATAHSGFKALSLMNAGGDVMCALDADGSAWCWGPSIYGTLGNGVAGYVDATAPVLVQTDERFVMLASSEETVCGLTRDGRLFCWGQNTFGEFGNGTTVNSAVPVAAAPGLRFTSVDMAGFYGMACGIATDARAYCWGRGALGDGQPSRQSLTPVLVAGGYSWKTISVASDHACGTDLLDRVLCWTANQNSHREIGVDSTGPILSPVLIPGIPPLSSVSAGDWMQCGELREAYDAICWGYVFDQPTHVPSPSGVVTRVSGKPHGGAALTANGTVMLFGYLPYCCDMFVSTAQPLVPGGGSGLWRAFAETYDRGLWAIRAADSTVFRWPPPTFSYADGLRLDFPIPLALPVQ